MNAVERCFANEQRELPELMDELPLWQAIRTADSWDELEALCDWVEILYQAGRIDLETAEQLGAMVLEAARVVPEQVECEIHPEALAGNMEDRCPCCGERVWWMKGAHKVCQVCHPNPQWQLRARNAA